MTNIEQKALELVNDAALNDEPWTLDDVLGGVVFKALCCTIEQHEAFRQQVSDAVEAVFAGYHDAPIPWVVMRRKLDRFIIAKPDPLLEAVKDILDDDSKDNAEAFSEAIRAALAKRGLEIREKE